jgi:hypothetical protein
MSIRFRLHYFFVSRDPYPILLRIYRMTVEPTPKAEPPKEPVLPQELAPEFKKRTNGVVRQELPEEMARILRLMTAPG